MFLAMALAKSTTHGQDGSLLLDVIASAWAHGRESPPLLGVDWPAVWDLPVGTGAEALKEPAVAFKAALDAALADTSEISPEVRSARAGLANRQVTIR